jgi:hypothetical protein
LTRFLKAPSSGPESVEIKIPAPSQNFRVAKQRLSHGDEIEYQIHTFRGALKHLSNGVPGSVAGAARR